MVVIRLLMCAVLAFAMTVPCKVLAHDPPSRSRPANAHLEPVDYRQLKGVAPDTLAGLARSELEGQKISMGEMKTAQVTAVYTDDNKSTLALSIVDYGAMPGAADGMAYWATMQMDQEGDDGYEKTHKMGEHAVRETYRTKNRSGDLFMLVEGRFLITITIHGLEPEAMQKAVKDLPLEKLAALAK